MQLSGESLPQPPGYILKQYNLVCVCRDRSRHTTSLHFHYIYLFSVSLVSKYLTDKRPQRTITRVKQAVASP